MRATNRMAAAELGAGCGAFRPEGPNGGRGGALALAIALGLLGRTPARADDPPGPPAPVAPVPAAAEPTGPVFREIAALTKGVRLPAVGSKGRTAIHRDPIEARLVRGTWAPPKAGETVVTADGTTKTWVEAKADEKGSFAGDEYEGGTYVSLPYDSPEEKVVLLHAVGNDFVYVNGEMRPGDPYGYGWLRLPIVVRKGANELLVRVSRGSLRVTLGEPPTPVYLSPDDATLPTADGPLGLVVVNATQAAVGPITIAPKRGAAPCAERLGPLTLRKIAVESAPATEPCGLWLGEGSRPMGSFPRGGAVEKSDEWVTNTTFRSDIDGSVQYYAWRSSGVPVRSLVLSLHGASVEATGQAMSYGNVIGRAIACPTNRRPYGFDWEDWGRLDVLEVLSLAEERFTPPSGAIYLTGHSMGGHGTWQLGATYPDRFAAIGPSAGWISFSTYAGGPTEAPTDAVEEILRRANNPSDTKALASNLTSTGIYILHGDADDNVPVSQAREMATLLGTFHKDWRLFEQPGAGHWWDVSKAPGADCVDWPPMFEYFAKHRRAPNDVVSEVDFTTMDPAVSSRCHWIEIVEQEKALAPSRVRIRRDADGFVGATENVARVRFDVGGLGEPEFDDVARVELDGKSFDARMGPIEAVKYASTGWGRESTDHSFVSRRLGGPLDWGRSSRKNPGRGGSFKTAFRNHFRLVYGTRGTIEESAASYARARLDAETWYYRGNGGADVLSDVDLLSESGRRDENVILYGNADTNGAWSTVLDRCPVRVGRGKIVVGDKTIEGDDLGCLLVYPRAGSTKALVGAVAGTGPAGLRATERLPIFSSGVAYPDVTILGADAVERGNAGVRGAGFFGNDWSIEHGEFAWHEGALTTKPTAPPSPAPHPSDSPVPPPVPVPVPGMDALPR